LWYQLSRNWRWWIRDTPPEAAGWLTAELRQALEAIEKPHVAKKRATVLLLASATANEVAWRDVFEDPRACNQRIWYQKWQHDPAISKALELATEQALLWRDSETAKVEAAKLQELRRALASGSIDAVQGMRMTAKEIRDRAGTEAAMKLIAMFAPDVAAPAQEDGGQGVPIDVRGSLELEGLSELGDEELDALIANLAAATGVAGGEPDDEG
jgi:hypothetical protein